MPNPDLDLAPTMAIIEPYLPMLSESVRKAFNTYQTLYPPIVKAAHDNAAAAKNVHRHILTEVTEAIDDLRGVALLDVKGLNLLNIHDRVVMRFKKMDEGGHSKSYPTAQALNFDRQLDLPGLPEAAIRLTFGYEPDLVFSEIVRVLVACPMGRNALWCVQVNEVESGAASWVDITPRRLTGTEPYRRYGTGDV